jgi:transposase-like protein
MSEQTVPASVLQSGRIHNGIQMEDTVIGIRKAFLAGETQSSIGRRLGVSKEVVRQVVRYITFKDIAPELKEACLGAEALGNKALSGEKVGEMRTLYRAGAMVSELAEKYGCTVSTIRAALLGKSKYPTDVPPIKKLRVNVAHGENHPHFKITTEKVNEIRRQFEMGETVVSIARLHNISYMHARRLTHGEARLRG